MISKLATPANVLTGTFAVSFPSSNLYAHFAFSSVIASTLILSSVIFSRLILALVGNPLLNSSWLTPSLIRAMSYAFFISLSAKISLITSETTSKSCCTTCLFKILVGIPSDTSLPVIFSSLPLDLIACSVSLDIVNLVFIMSVAFCVQSIISLSS